jgi:ABC-type sugar transport system substrate-binding protein
MRKLVLVIVAVCLVVAVPVFAAKKKVEKESYFYVVGHIVYTLEHQYC